MPLDITISPLYRVGGKDQVSLPGLMAAVPPARPARGRDQDRLIAYLLLSTRGILSSGDCVQAVSRAAVRYYATPGTITNALRTAAQAVNQYLHERNHAAPGQQGMYGVGVLALGVIREAQLTLLLSGPMQAYYLHAGSSRHITDSMSGRGLGIGLTTAHYFQQLQLGADDRIVLGTVFPSIWQAALKDAGPASLDATRRRLMAASVPDLNAVIVGATEGRGVLTIQRPPVLIRADQSSHEADATQPSPAEGDQGSASVSSTERGSATSSGGQGMAGTGEAAAVPSAYGIPPRQEHSGGPTPDAAPPTSAAGSDTDLGAAELRMPARKTSILSPEQSRRAAKAMVGALEVTRGASEHVGQAVGKFLPRLLPGQEPMTPGFGSSAMMFVAVLVPLIVVTIATAVYFRYGRSVQYEQYVVQAQDARAQAVNLTDPVAQRQAWQRELFYLDRAETYSETADTRALRSEAQAKLDQLLGIVRLPFQPVLSSGLGVQIGRLAAADNEIYVLDAQRGSVLHLGLTDTGFRLDGAFHCAPGSYGDYTVGPLVDILALPDANTISATVLGVDAAGTLLYCSAGQVAQAAPLPPPDTNWGRVKAFTLDGGNLYVLDSRARAVWVYVGKDGTFVDRPYFFFGGQIPELQDAIDLAVSADDLFVLHSDGRLSTCSYSRIDTVPTRCVDPAGLVNPFPAYRDVDLFSEAHFTQMTFSPPPDPSLALLDADGEGVFRFAPRSLELQSQWRAQPGRASSLPSGPVSAMAISPNHVLYFALRDRLYFASDTP